MSLSPQEEFDKKYITSSEILDKVGVSRSALTIARTRGLLPNAIRVQNGHILIWERDFIKPYVEEWSRQVEVWRSYRGKRA